MQQRLTIQWLKKFDKIMRHLKWEENHKIIPDNNVQKLLILLCYEFWPFYNIEWRKFIKQYLTYTFFSQIFP